MYLSWKKRLEQNPSLKDINYWPGIDIITLKKTNSKKFIRNKIIVSRVILGEKICKVAEDFPVSRQYISYLLNRCLAGFDYEEPNLTAGLVPNAKLYNGQRKSKLSINSNSGARGSFQYILNKHPDIKMELDSMIKAYVTDSVYGQNLTPGVFHKKFLELLVQKNWPTNKYPFDKGNLASETCRKYFHKQSQKFSLPKIDQREIVIPNKTLKKYCFEEVEIDSQLMDINCNIVVEVDGMKSTLRISRLTLIMAVDVASNCILAYHISYSKEPTQYDLLSLLVNIHSEWEPREICIPNTSYEPGACLPGALSKDFRSLGIGILKLDNALCHHAYSIKDYMCDELATTLNFGLPATPRSRNAIEYAFNRLNKFLHRFKSTTGSHHKDPNRESARLQKKPPLLNIKELEDFLSIILTGHNVMPQKVLRGKTPLDVLKEQFEQFPLLLNFKADSNKRNPFEIIERVKVYGYKKERKSPVVSFKGMKYRGPGINDIELFGKEIIILVDVKDIRAVKASTYDGKYLGELVAPKSWQNLPLSLTTYQKISKTINRKKLLSQDYQSGYFESLLKDKHQPKKATEIIRVTREFLSEYSRKKEEIASPIRISSKNTHISEVRNIKTWSPSLVKELLGSNNEQ